MKAQRSGYLPRITQKVVDAQNQNQAFSLLSRVLSNLPPGILNLGSFKFIAHIFLIFIVFSMLFPVRESWWHTSPPEFLLPSFSTSDNHLPTANPSNSKRSSVLFIHSVILILNLLRWDFFTWLVASISTYIWQMLKHPGENLTY